jgi:hypothetical protein
MTSFLRVPKTVLIKSIGLVCIFINISVSTSFAAPSPVRLIDVVSLSWPGAAAMNASVKDAEKSIREVVAPNWRDFTRAQGSPEEGYVDFAPGIIAAESIGLSRPIACEGSGSLTLMSSVQREFYRIQNISNYENRYLLIMTPDAGCIWQGKAILGESTARGGVITLHNTASGFVITHELGHAFGLGHSNLMSCSNGANDGTWGKTCRAIEYGGAIDVMANVETTSPLSTYHQWRMGLIAKNFIHQSWVNEEIALSASDVYGPTRAIFARDGNSTYWIEYRRGFGQYRPGLAIYRTDPPPMSAVESLNSTDISTSDPGIAVTSDVWLLNWDDYRYSLRPTAASGSMTLPFGKTATVFSGNISISARSTSDPTVVMVTMNRKVDRTSPPTPAFSDPKTWRGGDTDIVIKGREDGESQIAYFELKMNEKVMKASQSEPRDWLPTFLNPLNPNPTIFVKDLPEGKYLLSIRSTDVWGNSSKWSTPQRVIIDRTGPRVLSAVQVQKVSSDNLTVGWAGVSDGESGLCETALANADGWITQRSREKKIPTFSFPVRESLNFSASVIDCLGNAVKGSVNVSSRLLVLADASAKSGKWNVLKDRTWKCTGQCSLTFSASDTLIVKLSSGSANIFVSSRLASRNDSTKLGVISNGNSKKNVSIQGSDFTISAIASFRFVASNFVTAQLTTKPADASMQNPEQVELSKIGFTGTDFTDEWTVLPMSRGTTLLDPTLDLCAATFNSESDRIQRRQVIATKPGSAYELLSSEVVRYANATAASNALAELQVALRNCIQNKGGTSQGGIFTPYTFYETPSNYASPISGIRRVIVRATLGDERSPRQLLAIYQFKGAIFSGLYVIKSGLSPLTDEEIVPWLEVSKVLASRM